MFVVFFQEELDLTAVHKKAMFELPPEKKWQLYLSKKKVSNAELEENTLNQSFLKPVDIMHSILCELMFILY